MGGVDGEGFRRREEGHEARPHAKPRPGRQTRRPRAPGLPAHHAQTPPRVLMGGDRRPGELGEPEVRPVLEEVRLGPAQSDIGDDHFAAEASAGLQHMGRLLGVKGHRQISAEAGRAEGLARIARETRGRIQGDDAGPRPLQGMGEAPQLRRQGPVQASAEEGVHHQARLARRLSQGRHVARPRLPHRLCVGGLGGPQRLHADRPPGLGQAPSDHIAVAAIVARPAKDARGLHRKAGDDGLGGGRARPLHQGEAGCPAGHGGGVGGPHLRHGQDLVRSHGLINARHGLSAKPRQTQLPLGELKFGAGDVVRPENDHRVLALDERHDPIDGDEMAEHRPASPAHQGPRHIPPPGLIVDIPDDPRPRPRHNLPQPDGSFLKAEASGCRNLPHRRIDLHGHAQGVRQGLGGFPASPQGRTHHESRPLSRRQGHQRLRHSPGLIPPRLVQPRIRIRLPPDRGRLAMADEIDPVRHLRLSA